MNGFTVLTTHKMDRDSINLLLENGIEVIDPPDSGKVDRRNWILENIRYASILIAGFINIDRTIIDKAINLELIVSRSSGVDHIDVAYAERKGICIANQPEAIAEAVAEHVVGLVISSYRNITMGHNYVIQGAWYSTRKFLRGLTLKGKTLGVLGMGRIGSLVSFYLRMLGISRILYWSRTRKKELEQLLKAEPANVDRILEESDIIVIALPMTSETRGMINYSLLSKVKKNALIVNVGRGGIIDEEALVRILNERDDILAALDVYEEEPLPPESKLVETARETGRLLLTPHNAGGTEFSMKLTSLLAARQVIHYVNTGEVWNPVTKTCKESKDIRGLWMDFTVY